MISNVFTTYSGYMQQPSDARALGTCKETSLSAGTDQNRLEMDQNVPECADQLHTNTLQNPPECGLFRKLAGSGYVKADTPSSVTSSLAFRAT